MTAFRGRGVSVDLPSGWEGQIRGAGAGPVASAHADATEENGVAAEPVVLHAATFALPATRGDYGSGAVEVMGGSDVLVCLLEHEREAAATKLFRREGIPRLNAAMFSPQTMQRTIAGMSGSQHFFQESGRPFCLYVVVGSHRTRGPLVRAADDVVASIQIEG